MSQDPVEFYAELLHTTDDAYLFFDGDNKIWIAKSKAKLEHIKDKDYLIEVPYWLALEEGII